MMSAIHHLKHWPYQRSLIMPKSSDPYFHLPSGFDSSNTVEKPSYNLNQSRAIAISEHMYDDDTDRLHLIFGPPGKTEFEHDPFVAVTTVLFLSCLGTGKSSTIAGIVMNLLSNNIFRKRKILICAPSNTACDELSCRILQRLSQQEQNNQHTLIRIGSQPPIDENLCKHFLDFLVLEKIFETVKENPKTNKVNLTKLQENILNKATIIVSTLNNCASSRLSSLVDQVDFVIIDEGENEHPCF
ncbi:unnamed protein product [Rotaria sp. Silwood2]|nr:unnamed protein product [Rotaria sp. Silwood2]CAF3021485.1 unnamed protein product [Rotaria sp. Silwood2]CAF3218547.1 unnamed protein product [Rotaria sp. Silwood2]CAF3354529.1 unnamed protein product [Rotaria sp. Silwood2]CAF3958895.1 unnamed protein product [Rotaria sp. Silwood2]